MAIPSNKAPAMETFLDSFRWESYPDANPKTRRECIEADECTTCSGPAVEFKDQLSSQEYTISGMCQTCQEDPAHIKGFEMFGKGR
jgi:hypothetical protein